MRGAGIWRPALILSVVFTLSISACGSESVEDSRLGESVAEPIAIRVVTFNIEDLRGDDLADPSHPRVRSAAATLQRLRPDILVVNEIAFDQQGSPGWVESEGDGGNARRFAQNFLGVSQAEGLEPLNMRAFMVPVNTGIASGLDLDRSGSVADTVPSLPPPNPDGSAGRQTAEGRAYGGDAWGFGTFPGQYGSALFVREGLGISQESVRTFRLLPWSAMPGARRPIDPETGKPWHSEDLWKELRLSSKSHSDVPVILPGGQVLHVLMSHPTPPAFDGPEGRNRARNHDEIRMWADYLDGADYLVDDSGQRGGLASTACFVIAGDLNADPEKGSSLDDPIGRILLAHPRVEGEFVPVADAAGRSAFPDLSENATSSWGLRVDYVLPSQGLEVSGGGVWRPSEPEKPPASDHFPVWMDLTVAGCESG